MMTEYERFSQWCSMAPQPDWKFNREEIIKTIPENYSWGQVERIFQSIHFYENSGIFVKA